MGHIKAHMDSLVYIGFVSAIGKAKLEDWLRYLNGLEKRVEKAKVDPQRDKLNQMTIDKVTTAYNSARNQYSNEVEPEQLTHVKWMIEELRISLFAQHLGTAYSISAKRIINRLDEINSL